MLKQFTISILLAASLAPIPLEAEVRSAPCPFSCATEGVPKSLCRDWREGSTCYMEDLRAGSALGESSGQTSAAECRDMRRGDLSRPSIEISTERPTGGYFDDKVKVSGAIEGNCLTEAGYYENGRKVEDIPIVTSRDFRRFEFEVRGRGDRMGEVRVYNVLGDRDIYELGVARGRYGRDPHLYDPLGMMDR